MIALKAHIAVTEAEIAALWQEANLVVEGFARDFSQLEEILEEKGLAEAFKKYIEAMEPTVKATIKSEPETD